MRQRAESVADTTDAIRVADCIRFDGLGGVVDVVIGELLLIGKEKDDAE